MRQSKCRQCGGLIYKKHPIPGEQTECHCSIWEYTKSGWQWLKITNKRKAEIVASFLSQMLNHLIEDFELPMVDQVRKIELLEAEIAKLKGEPQLPLEDKEKKEIEK